MKKVTSFILMFLLSFFMLSTTSYAKEKESKFDNMSKEQIDQIVKKYNLERVEPKMIPEGVKPLKITTEKELQDVMPIAGNLTVSDENNQLYSKTPGSGESVEVQYPLTNTPRVTYSYSINAIGTKLNLYAAINFTSGRITSSGIYMSGITALNELENPSVVPSISGNIVSVTGECSVSIYVLIKTDTFKVGTTHYNMYLKYIKHSTGLEDFHCFES